MREKGNILIPGILSVGAGIHGQCPRTCECPALLPSTILLAFHKVELAVHSSSQNSRIISVFVSFFYKECFVFFYKLYRNDSLCSIGCLGDEKRRNKTVSVSKV